MTETVREIAAKVNMEDQNEVETLYESVKAYIEEDEKLISATALDVELNHQFLILRYGGKLIPMFNPKIIKQEGGRRRFMVRVAYEKRGYFIECPKTTVIEWDSKEGTQTKEFNGSYSAVLTHDVRYLNGEKVSEYGTPNIEVPSAERSKRTIRRVTQKIGRNHRCPCGSGLKFKKCHGR